MGEGRAREGGSRCFFSEVPKDRAERCDTLSLSLSLCLSLSLVGYRRLRNCRLGPFTLPRSFHLVLANGSARFSITRGLACQRGAIFFFAESDQSDFDRRFVARSLTVQSLERASLPFLSSVADRVCFSFTQTRDVSSTASMRTSPFRLSRFAAFGPCVFNTLKSEINGIILIRRPNGLSVRFSLCEPHEKRRVHPADPAQKWRTRVASAVSRGRKDRRTTGLGGG